MNKNIIISLLTAMAAVPAFSQETYESAQIATEDLNGTAKYVGMGGAMEALGADISTIGTNPAGIGLFRKSWVGTSFGLSTSPEQAGFANTGKTNADFGQIGFVVSSRVNRNSYINIGFNYHKGRNFNEILAATGGLNGGSQNKLSYMKGKIGSYLYGGFDPAVSSGNEYIGFEDSNSDYTSRTFSQVDYLYWNAFIPDTQGTFGYNEASGYDYQRETRGYIGNYDINISGNSNNRFYWGVTVGIKDVHYDCTTVYTENLIDAANNSVGGVTLSDSRIITGQGYDVKAGVIIRPVEDSPFRFGVSVATPTWYELTSDNVLNLYNNSSVGSYDTGRSSEEYTYKVFTPWKLGVSLGHTVDQTLALGLSYEFADYSSLSNRYITEMAHDGMASKSEKDPEMNANTEYSLAAVHTLKLGAELKITPELAVRAGYNYVSPMYKTEGYRDGGLNSDGVYYSSTTDYTNWKTVHRTTFGLGYAKDHLSIDLAYQYQTRKGDFYPFQSLTVLDDNGAVDMENSVSPTAVKDQRHQLILTLGYKF